VTALEATAIEVAVLEAKALEATALEVIALEVIALEATVHEATVLEATVLEVTAFLYEYFPIGITRTYTTSFFVPVYSHRELLFINKDRLPRTLDWAFLTRPLHFSVWFVLVPLFCVLILVSGNGKMFGLISGLLFTLIQAYFSGVQTQFFTSPEKVSFNSVQEAFGAFPTWKPVVREGYTIFLEQQGKDGMIELADFFERIKIEEWSKYKVNSYEEGLQLLLNEDGVILYGSELDVNRVYSNEFKSQGLALKEFDINTKVISGLITKKNSPLKRIFDPAITQQKELGSLDHIIANGHKSMYQSQLSSDEVAPLSMYHLISIFVAYLCITIIVQFILLFEVHYWKNKSSLLRF
jgi:hypothetical protein